MGADDGTVYLADADAPNPHHSLPVQLILHPQHRWGCHLERGAVDHRRADAQDRRARIQRATILIWSATRIIAALIITSPPFLAVAPRRPAHGLRRLERRALGERFQLLRQSGQHAISPSAAAPTAGATWSAPVRVNDDPPANGMDQFLPSIGRRPRRAHRRDLV